MKKNIRIITKNALLLALLIVSSFITVPIGVVPFTFQILTILIIILITKWWEALAIICLYIILGLIGLPVFAGFSGGLAYILKMSFGFILGFIFMVPIIKICNNTFSKIIKNQYIVYFISALIGVVIDYLFGFLYALFLVKILALIELNWSIYEILFNCVLIFIPFDIAKCVVAVIVSKRLNAILYIKEEVADV